MTACSDNKKSVFYMKGKCFNGCEATLAVGVDRKKTELYVCMEELAKMSEYFRIMFFSDFKEKKQKKFQITDETPEDMIRFFNAISPDPKIREIADGSVELLMCLADKFQSDLLKVRLKLYIEENEGKCKSAAIILNWLIWSVQYHMPQETVKLCLPGVACLQLSTLRTNREKIGWELFGKLVDAKLQLNYKASEVSKKNIICLSCCTCRRQVIDRLPYEIQWCVGQHAANTYLFCPSCLLRGMNRSYKRNCTHCDSYYKCSQCQLDPLSYKNKDQCLCARKNYDLLLKNI